MEPGQHKAAIQDPVRAMKMEDGQVQAELAPES